MSQDELNTSKVPDPEVVPQAKRRRFSAEYKLRILEEVDACHESGQIGSLLRREGLYSSHLMTCSRKVDSIGQVQAVCRSPQSSCSLQDGSIALCHEQSSRWSRKQLALGCDECIVSLAIRHHQCFSQGKQACHQSDLTSIGSSEQRPNLFRIRHDLFDGIDEQIGIEVDAVARLTRYFSHEARSSAMNLSTSWAVWKPRPFPTPW